MKKEGTTAFQRSSLRFLPCAKFARKGSCCSTLHGVCVAINEGALIFTRRFASATTKNPGYWAIKANQQGFLEKAGQELGVKELSDWYGVQRRELVKRGGGRLFTEYRSLEQALRAIYPNYPWQATQFAEGGKVRNGFWEDKHNQKDFFEKIGKELKITELSGWYGITKREILKKGGKALLDLYPSLVEAIQASYPDYPWDPAKFADSSSIALDTKRAQLESIGSSLGIQRLSDWYRITAKELEQFGGGPLLAEYSASIEQLVRALYPTYAWQSAKFSDPSAVKNPPGHWQTKSNLMKALDMAEKKIGIKNPEDWQSVTLTELKDVGITAKISKTQLAELLKEKYPDHNWEKVYLLRGRYAQQKKLEKMVAALFPSTTIMKNVRKEAKLKSPTSGEYLELDIYLPTLNLAFEYQEKHHYTNLEYMYQTLDVVQERDKLKKKMSSEKSITLITVPFWWDGKQASLVATIKKARPDLLTHIETKTAKEKTTKKKQAKKKTTTKPKKKSKPKTEKKEKEEGKDAEKEEEEEEKQEEEEEEEEGEEEEGEEGIPEEMPVGALGPIRDSIEDIGQPITASFLTRVSTNPAGWWVFEKYDGVRGFWNPKKKAFYSRHGNKFLFPQKIIDLMPADLFLDGELWFGRDNFQEAMKISNRVDVAEIDWSKFKYMVFDSPNNTGMTYQERYALLEKKLANHECMKYVEIAKKEECRDTQHLEEIFQHIMDAGGEGIILRDPRSPYQAGRSQGFLKHKKYRDAEARIIGPAGAHQWECEMPSGVTFIASAGTTEFSKKWKPQQGDIVSFKHRGFLLGSKKPKLPTIFRLRPDMTWQDVINNSREKKAAPPALPLKKASKKHRTKGYWQDVENRKKFFIQFAAEAGFDPMKSANWKKVKNSQIIAKKGQGLLKLYQTLNAALADTFPDNFGDKSKRKRETAHWLDPASLRAFFDAFAEESGFDPLDVNRWYGVTTDKFEARKGGATIKRTHGGFRRALQTAYPELTFKNWQKALHSDSRQHFADVNNLRRFLDDAAKDLGFDPLDPDAWYKMKLTELSKRPRGQTLLHYPGGIRRAITTAYPEVSFTKWATRETPMGNNKKQ